MKDLLDRTLQGLLPGQSGVILSVGNQSGAVKRRLVDMGLTPGTRVTVKRTAPFGDPMEITLRGYALSLRREDAAQILVSEGEPRHGSNRPTLVSYAARRLDPEALRRLSAAARRQTRAPDGHASWRADGRTLRAALVGNPNSGKTTLYNALTGSKQYVGNWPGVTVEKKEGVAGVGDGGITIIDLPGIYALSPYSIEELVTRDCILGRGGEEKPDAVINIVDAANIERNMYLTTQLLELECPMVVALSFMDEALGRGDIIDVARLSKELGIPVVPVSAKTGENLRELLLAVQSQVRFGSVIEPDSLYDEVTHEAQRRIERLIRGAAERAGLPAHWAAVKLLEGDAVVLDALKPDADLGHKLEFIAWEYGASGGSGTSFACGDGETRLADSRYRCVEGIVRAAVKKGERPAVETMTDRIDRIATHRYFAVPVFLMIMLIMFTATFGPAGALLSDGMSFLIGIFSGWASSVLSDLRASGWLAGLLTNGVVAGVGGVVKYLPQIALLFFFLSFLEDSGYMARAAFIMDRVLRHFGLSGKAFIPLLMGFGCSVPAVMSARTMENEKDRRLTILLIPFMSCSAKLPVYGLLASAFFGAWAGLVVFSLYIAGMAMAAVSGFIFKQTLFRGDPAPFVLELPPYRIPGLNNLLTHVWERVRGFLIKAGTLIFVMSVVLWFLQNFNLRLQMTADSADSILCAVGTALAPFFKPMGFGMWQAVVALLTGLVAKEAVVASLSMFYGFSLTAGGLAVAAAMTGFTPLSALSYLVFILLYTPCMATVATVYRELGSLKYTAVSAGWQLLVAGLTSMLVYQAGRFAGL